MELNEQEAHCVARRLQGVLYANDQYIGCRFCKFPCERADKKSTRRAVMDKLSEATGVDLSGRFEGILRAEEDTPFKPHDFPYKTFLKGSSDELKDFYRNFFRDV